MRKVHILGPTQRVHLLTRVYFIGIQDLKWRRLFIALLLLKGDMNCGGRSGQPSLHPTELGIMMPFQPFPHPLAAMITSMSFKNAGSGPTTQCHSHTHTYTEYLRSELAGDWCEYVS